MWTPAVTGMVVVMACVCMVQVTGTNTGNCPKNPDGESTLMNEVKRLCCGTAGSNNTVNDTTSNGIGCLGDCMISEKQGNKIVEDCIARKNGVHPVATDNSKRKGKVRNKRSVTDLNAWPNFKWDFPIRYKIEPGFSATHQTAIRKALGHWVEKTCVRFLELSRGEDLGTKPHVVFKSGEGCISFVGKVEKQPQPLYLDRTCFKYLTVTHEVGHLLGMWHTHQQPGRTDHVTVKVDHIKEGEEGSFIILPEMLVLSANKTGYDFASIMHYDRSDLSDGGLVIETVDPLRQGTIGQRVEVSFLDAKSINNAYCPDACDGKQLTSPCHNGGYQDPRNCSVCICPDGWASDFCQQLSSSQGDTCGGEMMATPTRQKFSSPRYTINNGYPRDQQCTWRIKTNTGRPIKMRFIGEFELHCTPFAHTCHDWVELRFRPQDTILGPRFCCEKAPSDTFTAETAEILVVFRAHSPDSTVKQRRGFTLEYFVEAGRCDFSPCANGGTCIGTGATPCECLQGYTGQFCQNPPVVSRCASNPCQAGGICAQTGQLCQCPTNRTGVFCQSPVTNPCQPSPCENGGICLVSSVGGSSLYFCICMLGYRGHQCEIAPNPCANLRCLYGRCVIQNGTGICVCNRGHTGRRCNIDVDECASSPCQNGGRCLNGQNAYRCVCPIMYTGPRCETEVDNGCDSSPCQNGRCIPNSQGSYRCACTGGWTGRNCDMGVNACIPRPCKNGATCRVQRGRSQYTCSCLRGFSGTNCTIGVNECVPQPCKNGGTCRAGRGSRPYTCTCVRGFSGTNCTISNTCTPNYCMGGGTCMRIRGVARCLCTVGRRGGQCEQVTNACGSNPCTTGRCIPLLQNTYRCVGCSPGGRCGSGDACSPGLCKNGGTCQPVGSSYHCRCRPGTTGRHCQLGSCGACGVGPGSVREPCVTVSTFRSQCVRTVTYDHTTTYLFFFTRTRRRTRTVYYTCLRETKHWETAFCCDNAKMVTDSNTHEKKCAVEGWVPFGHCSGYCGGCGVSVRHYYGLTQEGSLIAGMKQTRPCNTAVCWSCTRADRLACRCAIPCCNGFRPVGQQCVANTRTAWDQAASP